MESESSSSPIASQFSATEERWSPAGWTGEYGLGLYRAIQKLCIGGRSGRTSEVRGRHRVAHHDGFVLAGTFHPNEANRAELGELTDFSPFKMETPVTARISNLRAPLDTPDIMGLAVKFQPGPGGSGEETDLLALSVDVLPTADSRGFKNLLEAANQSYWRRIARMVRLVVTQQASTRALWRGFTASRVNHGNGFASRFHGIVTFRLVKASGPDSPVKYTPFRFSWVPENSNPVGFHLDRPDRPEKEGDPPAPATFRLKLQVRSLEAQMSDRDETRLDDPRFAWDRHVRVIDAGQLHLRVAVEPPGEPSFNPGHLATGLAAGDNDLFSNRQSAHNYALIERSVDQESL